ncbi:LuxR family transcriptional regulator [Bradyrhizobium tropiciagri]|uniref:LuxR family transcriptional regulator n=1 Tax=Bradyrhizobium tropiciagri TaxID=312253 RepID=UPI001BAE1A52|nr:LuxR family transcriptional regulator [Bradyrhizobium tropiciagri]
MHASLQRFIDLLFCAETSADFTDLMAATAAAFDLSSFAYLALPNSPGNKPQLISTYPAAWTSHYLRSKYERIDPVIMEVVRSPEPFQWGLDLPSKYEKPSQRQFFDEAERFGIRFGFTVPIHDGHGPIAALTFATDQRKTALETCVKSHARVLQLMAMYFHAHVSRKLTTNLSMDGTALSHRELECLEWASQGKSAWAIGRILGLSRNTVAYYLENAKEKLGVRTITQAVACLAAAKETKQK